MSKKTELGVRQYEFVLPITMTLKESGPSFADLCEEASIFLNGSDFINFVRLTADKGSQAIQDERIRQKYDLAIDIQWGVVKFGRNGWERSSELPREE